mgnify:CR=1 FL=1
MSQNSIKTRFLVGLILVCAGVFSGLILLVIQNSLSNDTAFAEDLIRLHVVANSNSPKDQDLKLAVRDAILQEAKTILGEIGDKERAYNLLKDHEQNLHKSAQEVVLAQGFDYPVEIKMGYFAFPHRDYGSLSLPEGWYDAVRVEIGEARGENWWCVLFPPLCLADLEGAEKNLVKVDQTGSSGHKLVFRSKLWEHVSQTRYAQALQRWWQASAAGFPVLVR